MPPVSLPYLDRRVRNGRDRWYFRHPSVPRTRVPGQPGEPAFQRTYSRLLDQAKGEQKAAKEMADQHSMRTLVEEYRASEEWRQLSEKTRKDYGRELDRLNKMAGDLAYSKLTRKGVKRLHKRVMADTVASRKAAIAARLEKDAAYDAAWEERVAKLVAKGKPVPARPKRKRQPPAPVTTTTGARTADYFKSVLSALMAWAIEEEKIDYNPAEGVKRIHRKKNVESRKPWTEYQIQTALKYGPRTIREGVILGVYTGQRGGDCCRLSKGQCVGPIVRIRQLKTGNLVDVQATGPLRDLIARRCGSNVEDDAPQLLLQDNGQPYTERLYRAHLRKWLDEQGWHDISFHGLRYAAAGTLNEAGATVATIISIIGHSTYEMALKYLAAREEQERAAKLMEEAAERRESGSA